MFLQRKKTLTFAVILSAIVLFNACGRFGGDPRKEVNREIKSVSRLLNSKKIKELKGELVQLKAGMQETNVNITMLENSVTNLKFEVDSLKPEYEELILLSKRTGEDSEILDQVRLLKSEIRLIEKDIKQLRKSKKRSDIQIWEQER